jgi:hypothetical protein
MRRAASNEIALAQMPERETLERDRFRLNRHRALDLLVEHDLLGKPASTFPDHALRASADST